MPDERACLSTLRGISARAAAILDRYCQEQSIWVDGAAFEQFRHTLHWGSFEELDLRLLDGLAPGDRDALLEELRAYHAYLRRQRERVAAFHHAYQRWLDGRNGELPPAYRERLRHWQHRYGTYDYYRLTGFGIKSGVQRFLANPEECMRAFEGAFAELEEQRRLERLQHAQARAYWSDWWASQARGNEYAPTRLEEALRLLELPVGATLAEIRHAYRACAKAAHPDRQGAESTERMVALNQAYAYLRGFYRSAEPEMRRTET